MPKKLFGFTVLPFFLILNGCDADEVFASVAQEKQDFHYTKPLTAGGRFSIENYNGSVEVSGWDRNDVEISGTKYARTKAYLDEVKIDIQSSAGGISVRTVPPVERWNTNSGARYIIRVPRRVAIDLAASTNGRVQIDSIEGPARIRTTNGSVHSRSVKGLVEITTTNGNVDVNDITGGVRVTTSNGSVHGDNLHGEFTARTSNGGIRARLFDVPTNSPVKVSTSNGGVDLIFDQVRSDVRASTSNGHIVVGLPANSNARVDARTSNSSVSSDLSVHSVTSSSKRHLEGTIGTGGPHLDLSTTNGSIRLTKATSI